ncbi:hypothetical protein [Rhizobium sp. CECT 9324]|uniref:hypothetical protein n=1 Tax=Rhizobium sp. CECT 9324 TaxID=2845820 RepID=UPI001E6599BC|nr:hypothetical protein [Rhizobium sp. CECT 9324]CAH0340503.1 hypothetical protein RHI9324_02171 [Rhizobium sp. CECT 9324]
MALGYDRMVLVRPGLIDGPRTEPRPAEQMFGTLLQLLKPVLPRSLQANRPETIARVMLEQALSTVLGVTVVTSDALV